MDVDFAMAAFVFHDGIGTMHVLELIAMESAVSESADDLCWQRERVHFVYRYRGIQPSQEVAGLAEHRHNCKCHNSVSLKTNTLEHSNVLKFRKKVGDFKRTLTQFKACVWPISEWFNRH